MRKTLFTTVFSLFLFAFVTSAHAGLDDLLVDLNTRALKDIAEFNLKLSAQFGLPVPEVSDIMKVVEAPADAFMCLQLGVLAKVAPERVVAVYRKHRKKGWGAIAQELGIKPGSAEFHALKRGDFRLSGVASAVQSKGAGKGQGKSKGKGKGQNK